MSELSNAEELYSRDPLPASLWREVIAASTLYAALLEEEPVADPVEFASRHPQIPTEILLPELQRIQAEQTQDQNQSVSHADWLEPQDRYTDLELIGTGGMGEIYRALDGECQRLVAIKKIRKEHQDNPEAQSRFIAEAELTAELEHPGIIPIYGKGIDGQGREFYVMRLISGKGTGTLTDTIRDFHEQRFAEPSKDSRLLPSSFDRLRDLVRRLVDVSDTIAYAHHQGIVHRDLKPSNILIGPFGETLIADWGLAKRIGSRADEGIQSPTHNVINRPEALPSSPPEATGSVGTPGYAAPELDQGKSREYLYSADIYSLGAILYCILSGTSPRKSEELLPCELNIPSIASLEAIRRKAMAKEISERYSTAEAFRQDLLHWIEGEPVSANPEDWWEKAIRWPSRNRSKAAGLTGALAIAFIAGSLFLAYQSRQAILFENQSRQLQLTLDKSESLLEQTRQAQLFAERAKQQAELAQQQAEQKEKEATDSRSLAEKRGDLAFDGLMRFQELITSNSESFHSKELHSLHEQLTGQSKEILEAILADLERDTTPSHSSLKRLGELTHRFAVLEGNLKRIDSSNAIFNRTCEWMQQRLDARDLPMGTEKVLQLQIGKLRSLQGTHSLRIGRRSEALPNLKESIQRLEHLIDDEELAVEDRYQAASSLACSLSSLSMVEFYEGNFERAWILQEQAIEHLGSMEPRTYDDAMVRVQIHGNMSLVCERASQIDRAIAELERASLDADIAEQRIAEIPGGVTEGYKEVKLTKHHLQVRSQVGHERARLLVATKSDSVAQDVLRSLLKKELASLLQGPTDSTALECYQTTAAKLQALLVSTGDHQGAIELMDSWVKLAENLVENHPGNDATMLFLIIAHHSLGHLNEQLGMKDVALEKYQQALKDCEQATMLSMQGPALAYQRVELELHLFQLQLSTAPWIEVEPYFERAMHSAEQLVGSGDTHAALLFFAKSQLARGISEMRTAGQEDAAQKWSTELRTKNLGP
jgi:serine/threonine protein kinase